MGAIIATEDLSPQSISETDLRGTGCRKTARPDLWGSGEATNRSTRKVEVEGQGEGEISEA